MITKTMTFTATLVAALVSLASCTISINGRNVTVSTLFHHDKVSTGVDTTVFYDVRKNFTEIEASGFYNIVYTDSVDRVEITCDEALVRYLVVKNQEDALVLGLKPLSLKEGGSISVLVPVSALNLDEIDLSGACRFESGSTLAGYELKVGLSGASRFEAEVEVKELEVELSGASKVILEGTADKFDVECSGAAKIEAAGLSTKVTEVECSGACKGEFTAEYLKAEVSGASKISINGDANTDIESSGVSKIERR